MGCDSWNEKVDAYVDGELRSDEAKAFDEHLRGCAICAAEALRKIQEKRAVHNAGQRFAADPAFRARIQRSIATPRETLWRRRWFPVWAAATAVVLVAAGTFFLTFQHDRQHDRRGEEQLISELVDQHVATLASSNPVDVISTDRHTVKPWFEGKIPFTFNLPELQGSAFVLVGGKVSYLGQSPGAELIFRIRQHQISVFIFQERESGEAGGETAGTALSFGVRSWRRNGLRYFVVGDASAQDLDKLSELIRAAG
jgi:anti-sigma factor RsiW